MGRMIPTILPPVYCGSLKTYYNCLFNNPNKISTSIGTIAPNGKLYEQWQIAWQFPVKPLHSLSELQIFILITFPAITYTKCCAVVLYLFYFQLKKRCALILQNAPQIQLIRFSFQYRTHSHSMTYTCCTSAFQVSEMKQNLPQIYFLHFSSKNLLELEFVVSGNNLSNNFQAK